MDSNDINMLIEHCLIIQQLDLKTKRFLISCCTLAKYAIIACVLNKGRRCKCKKNFQNKKTGNKWSASLVHTHSTVR